MKVLFETPKRIKLVERPAYKGIDMNYFEGTVDVEFGHKTLKAVECRVYGKFVSLDGFIGRYHTSANPWLVSAHADFDKDGKVFAHFGRDDRSGRFHKESGISYEPETYAIELAKVRAENAANQARRDAKKAAKKATKKVETVTVAKTGNAKYEYPAGLTAAQKKAFRAKARKGA